MTSTGKAFELTAWLEALEGDYSDLPPRLAVEHSAEARIADAGSKTPFRSVFDRLNRVLLPIGEASGLPERRLRGRGLFLLERDQVIGPNLASRLPRTPFRTARMPNRWSFMGLPLLSLGPERRAARVP